MFLENLFFVYIEILENLDVVHYFHALPKYIEPFSFLYNASFIYALKLTTSLLFLVFIRAGLPRYRYDYLTILGWSQFLIYNLFVLIALFIIYILF